MTPKGELGPTTRPRGSDLGKSSSPTVTIDGFHRFSCLCPAFVTILELVMLFGQVKLSRFAGSRIVFGVMDETWMSMSI